MGRLTTHVLDTSLGRPAEGLKIELWAVGGGAPLKTLRTNADGRTSEPLLGPDEIIAGSFELHFYAGDYLRRTAPGLKEPLFLDIVPIRFGITDAGQHYHVPLLLSPFGYSTYRGS